MARIQKSGVTPNFVPRPYCRGRKREAYLMGWCCGHGIACHNVPKIGQEYWTEASGRTVCAAENASEIHQDLCFAAAQNARCNSPWEFVAREINNAIPDRLRARADQLEVIGLHRQADDAHSEAEYISEELWEAYEAGETDAIHADLRGYTYGDD